MAYFVRCLTTETLPWPLSRLQSRSINTRSVDPFPRQQSSIQVTTSRRGVADQALKASAPRIVDGYRIGRDETESQRLNTQHDVYIKNIGYILHPSITARLPPNAHIADIGTGTGVFLLDLASHLPSTTTLDGFDISSAQIPFTSSTPSNVAFHVANAKQPFPGRLHRRYDVVCLRLLVAGMEERDWGVVTQNVLHLLKPGGAIQWVEADHSEMFRHPMKSSAHAMTQRMQRWGTSIVNGVVGERLRYGWSTLPSIFEEQGLERVVHEVFDSDACVETRDVGTSVQIAVCRSIASVAHRVQGFGGVEGVERMIGGVEEDQRTGAFIRWRIHVAVGFKAPQNQ